MFKPFEIKENKMGKASHEMFIISIRLIEFVELVENEYYVS